MERGCPKGGGEVSYLCPRPMRTLFLIFCLMMSLLPFAAGAQSGNWAEGFVFLENGDTLRGPLSLNRRNGLLLVDIAGKTKTYSAQQVAGFFLMDQGRAFGTFPYKEEGRPVVQTFFEIITVGRCLSLLTRETDLQSDQAVPLGQDASNFYSPVKTTKQELYFMDHTGTVKRIPGKRKPALALLPNAHVLDPWLKGRRLNTNRTEEMKELVEFYNLNTNQCDGKN